MATEESSAVEAEYRVYLRRWLVLAIFVLYSGSNGFHWVQYSIIANIICKYYSVDSSYVDYTSVVFMIVYIILIFPGSYFLEKKGLRLTVVIGSALICIGSWIKFVSVSPDLFWVGFLGQTIEAIAQVFLLSVPPKLAAVWFGPNEISLACGIGVFGNQLGIAFGFLLPPILVQNSDDLNVIGDGLWTMFLAVGIFTSVLFIVVLLFFQNKPQSPPSQAQAIENELTGDFTNFSNSLKVLFKNPGYILLMISYGIDIGVVCALATLLNQIVLKYYPGSEEDAGRIGLINVCIGMVAAVFYGYFLDRTHRFKQTAVSIYLLMLLSAIVFTFTLSKGIVAVYLSVAFLGFFMTGYLPVGFEVAAEITYPVPEGTSSGLLNTSGQVFGIVLTLLYSWLYNDVGDMWANVVFCVLLLIGLILTVFMKVDLKRQAALNAQTNVQVNGRIYD